MRQVCWLHPSPPQLTSIVSRRSTLEASRLHWRLKFDDRASFSLKGNTAKVFRVAWIRSKASKEDRDRDRSHSVRLNGVMAPRCAENLHWHEGCVERRKREKLLNQRGCIVWMTGLSGSGKSTLSCTLDHILTDMGKLSYILDGDNIRHGLSQNLGFSAKDREENVRRVGEVAKLFADTGVITLVSFISPYQRDRDFVRTLVPPGDFVEVYMKVPLEVCENRDCKGLYKLARSGVLKGFTGVDDPYEIPQNPDVVIEATNAAGEFFPAEQLAGILINYLKEKGFLECPSC